MSDSLTTPHWTRVSYLDTGGRDHLGMAGVISGRVLPMLSPRVVAATGHPRYWSFYSWLLAGVWEHNSPPLADDWYALEAEWEFLFSVGAAGALCGRIEHETVDGGIVGSLKTTAIGLNPDRDLAFQEYFESSKSGGYGAQYAGSLHAAGLTTLSASDPALAVDALTERGAQLAAAFTESVGGTALATRMAGGKTFASAPPSRPELSDFMKRACVCAARAPHAERDLLRDAIAGIHHPGDIDGARQRRTLQLYVDLAKATDGAPVDQDDFRQLVYFRRLGRNPYEPHLNTLRAARHWRLYQARAYVSYALNRLWQWLTEWIHAHPDARTEGSVAVADALHAARAVFVLRPGAPGLDQPLHQWTAWAVARGAAAHSGRDDGWQRSHEDEDALQRRSRPGADVQQQEGECVPDCLAIIALVVHRLRDWEGDDVDQGIMAAGDEDRVSLDSLTARWNAWTADDTPIGDVLDALLRRYVIDQHVRTSYSKLPTRDTLRFSVEGARLRVHDRPADVSESGARFVANSRVTHELGFTGAFPDANHGPTADGLALLDEVIE
jgi:hypothetical protein